MEIPERMKAVVLQAAGEPLVLEDVPVPRAEPGEILIRVEACGVCRTDLHILDGELEDLYAEGTVPGPKYPLVLGHQIVGRVVERGDGVTSTGTGDRVGVPWLGGTDGVCPFCRAGRENLCDAPTFTGYHSDGGFAEYATARAAFALPLPEAPVAANMAPWLCAGLIGYRALRLAGGGAPIGLYGFGSSAHLLAQVLRHQGRRFFAFTRPGDGDGQRFAMSLGAAWAGGSDEAPPEPMAAAILFAPVGALVPQALRAVAKGGRVVSAGIHMSDIPSFPYRILWGERSISSVANLTREDGREFLELAPRVPIETRVTTYPLAEAAQALEDLRRGAFEGSAVLVMGA